MTLEAGSVKTIQKSFKTLNSSEYFTQGRSTLTGKIRKIYAIKPYELELVAY